jgi:hypothetical protein
MMVSSEHLVLDGQDIPSTLNLLMYLQLVLSPSRNRIQRVRLSVDVSNRLSDSQC